MRVGYASDDFPTAGDAPGVFSPHRDKVRGILHHRPAMPPNYILLYTASPDSI